MKDMLSVAAVAIISSVCAVVVRRYMPELSLLLVMCAGAGILLFCSGALKTVTEFADKLIKIGNLSNGVIAPAIKITGIAFVTQIGAHFCKDAKEATLAMAVETAGSVFALLTVLPLMSAVLDLLAQLIS